MTITSVKLTYAEYLSYEDEQEILYELEDGVLIPMAPPSPLHCTIAFTLHQVFNDERRRLKYNWFISNGNVGLRTTSGRSRYPDLLIIEGATWQSFRRQPQAIIEDAPVLLIVEIVSPGIVNRQRDYESKVREYQNLGIPEYWIVDPLESKVTVLTLVEGAYQGQEYQGDEVILSSTFSQLSLTANQILAPEF